MFYVDCSKKHYLNHSAHDCDGNDSSESDRNRSDHGDADVRDAEAVDFSEHYHSKQ